MKKLRNALAKLLYSSSEWLRDHVETLAERLESFSEKIYSPEVDAKDAAPKPTPLQGPTEP